MKKLFLLLSLFLCLTLAACGGNSGNSAETDTPQETQSEETSLPENGSSTETPLDETLPPEESEVIQDSTPQYFESDEIVDKFFSAYNLIAEITIPAEEIEKGNIRTKALVYIDDLSIEIINAGDFLSLSMSCDAENEATKLYAIYRDAIAAMNTEISEDDIQLSWNAIHETGYLVEDYDLNGISITYVPSKELSWGTSNLRVDIEIPLK